MNRRSLAFFSALAWSITLSFIPVTAQRSDERRNAKPSGARSTGTTPQTPDVRGTDQSPLTVRVLPTPKTQEEAAQERAERQDQSSANWRLVQLTGLLAAIGAVQTVVFAVQAHRLKQTIAKMQEIAAGQTADMQASIKEATRAATAMEGVAVTLAESTRTVQNSLLITKDMADTQRFVFELANRAWLVVTFDSMGAQDNEKRLSFEPHFNLINRGNTPAYNITVLVQAEVQPFPLSADFAFALPKPVPGSRISVIGPGLSKRIGAALRIMYSDIEAAEIRAGVRQRIVSWGLITYSDAFQKQRFVKFSFNHFKMSTGDWFSQDTGQHSESD
jgi:hypothetical protein